MATKYGYVERNLENDVNWGAVGKGFSDMLLAERDERKAKKEFLDDKMVETQNALKKSPLGYDTNYNDKMISLSSNGSSFLYALEKDLKQGKITPEDYLRTIQRMNGSLDEIFNLSNNYNALYEEHLNRVDSEGASYMETKLFEDIDNMTKFNEYDFFLDSSGIIGAAPLVKGADGLTTIDPTKARSAQAIYNLAQNFINKVPLEEETKAASDRLAKFVRETSTAASYANPGMTKSYDDIRRMPEFNTLKEALIDGILSTPNKTASVLVDHIKGYEPEPNLEKIPAADREKYVYLNTLNGKEANAELTKEQTKIARDRVGLLLEGMISSEGFTGPAKGVGRDPLKGVDVKIEGGEMFNMPFYVGGKRLSRRDFLINSMAQTSPDYAKKDIEESVDNYIAKNPGEFNSVDSGSHQYQEKESLPQKVANESYEQINNALRNVSISNEKDVVSAISPILKEYGLTIAPYGYTSFQEGFAIRDESLPSGKQIAKIDLADYSGNLEALIRDVINPIINKKRKISDIIEPKGAGNNKNPAGVGPTIDGYGAPAKIVKTPGGIEFKVE